MTSYLFATLIVVGMACGQILFKLSANALEESGTFLAIKPAAILLAAFFLYGIVTIAWVWLLQKVELGRIYPFMAISYILVPLGSYFVFAERFQLQYFVGVAMIIAGIIIASRA